VTLVLAHRGANREAPENTVAAFRRAVELGADGVELDVHPTRDHHLVVRHDGAGPAGVIPEMTLAEVVDAMPEVPTLEAVLDVCAGRLVNVEIKNSAHQPGFDPTDRAAGLLVELLARRGGDRVLVSSFNLATVDRVRELAPGLPTAWLVFGVDAAGALAVAHEHGHQALHPDVGSLAGARAGDLVAEAHARAMAVNVWTVNERDEIARLLAVGVDAIVTDVPDVALDEVSRGPRA
jgi:glycerophosphoryl diester phosphodiesterase